MLSLDKLVFDPSVPGDGASVGAYLRDAAGNLLTSTLVGADQALDVNIVAAAGLGVYDEDSAHTSGDKAQAILAVRRDADTSLVGTDGDYAPLQVDADGFLKVRGKITVEAGDAEYLEDAAHANADAGLGVFAVRQDVLSSLVSASGDYANFKTDVLGRLYTTNQRQTLSAPAAASVTNAAATLIASPLAGRTQITIQNLGNKDIFIGKDNTVTAANGLRVSAGSSATFEWGSAIAVFAITDSGTADVRLLEAA
jgi:hypothetical protein